MTTIAIADHDNTRGAREALPIAAQLGIELIPAIEFTCRWDACPSPSVQDIDVLGYFVNWDDPEFQSVEQTALDDAHSRIAECCAHLTAAGYAVTLDTLIHPLGYDMMGV